MKLIAANWKMNKTQREAEEYVSKFLPLVKDVTKTEILLCPPFTSLCKVSQMLEGSNVKLGAQNCHSEKKGAFTGEISTVMLKDLGVEYVIVGHSERRWIFGESDEIIHKKIVACLEEGLRPILCVGERWEDREAGMTFKVIETQIKLALSGLDAFVSKIDIAYEPVWAIGTGNPATPEDAQLVHRFIKDLVGPVRVLYGGSVNTSNAGDFLRMPDVDGLLVGTASLDPESFFQIIQASENHHQQEEGG
ncbi:triosephosphate isomerase [Thermocrinis albus DSM 14484]|uniref:Triosephosphate isomerase n=1 Tax=Thermocrinis albus (strain DSM 14484 / JCM 11386 / HI 11/12) TaxID=638303 RepID=D3SL27_THEAH|nr:triose-phosphate isomerase [Thermocrinis albus]ADC89457.1 triosephosphate isomerase [Thermocrinis albus DSM 14484]